jgi:hypothetical protein
MSDTRLLPPPTPDFNAAKRQYVELYGSLAVMNTYLKIAVLSLCLVCLGQAYVTVKIYQLFRILNRSLSASMTWAGPRR